MTISNFAQALATFVLKQKHVQATTFPYLFFDWCSITRQCSVKSMNQLFYNIASGIVHQIRCDKRTTITEVIVRGKRNIKQNRNWFYFKFSAESSSFIL